MAKLTWTFTEWWYASKSGAISPHVFFGPKLNLFTRSFNIFQSFSILIGNFDIFYRLTSGFDISWRFTGLILLIGEGLTSGYDIFLRFNLQLHRTEEFKSNLKQKNQVQSREQFCKCLKSKKEWKLKELLMIFVPDLQILRETNFCCLKMLKTVLLTIFLVFAIFDKVNFSKSISGKIRVAGKLLNFHTVTL